MTLSLSEPQSTNRVLLVSGLGSLLLHGIVLTLLNMVALLPLREEPPTRVQVRLIPVSSEHSSNKTSPAPQPVETPTVPLPTPPQPLPGKPSSPAQISPKDPAASVQIPPPPQAPTPKISQVPPAKPTQQLMKMAHAAPRLPQPPSASALPQRSPARPMLPPPTLGTTKSPTRPSALPPPPITTPQALSEHTPSMPETKTTSPSLVSSSKPVYPLVARDKGWEGISVVRVLIDTEGHPTEIHIHTSSGFPALDQSAMEAIKSWTFTPAKDGNIPFAKWVNIPIKFSLRE